MNLYNGLPSRRLSILILTSWRARKDLRVSILGPGGRLGKGLSAGGNKLGLRFGKGVLGFGPGASPIRTHTVLASSTGRSRGGAKQHIIEEGDDGDGNN